MVFTCLPTVRRSGIRSVSCGAPERVHSDQGQKLLPISLFNPMMGYYHRQLFSGPETSQYLSIYGQSATELSLPENRDATISAITDAKSSVSSSHLSQRLNCGRQHPCCLVIRIRFLPFSSRWSRLRRRWSGYCIKTIAWGYETRPVCTVLCSMVAALCNCVVLVLLDFVRITSEASVCL